jgi:hypothetical protein
MNKLIIIFIIALTVISCKNEKKENSVPIDEKAGVYEVVFIDVNNTEIADDADPNVLMERKLLPNLNLVEADQFWNSKSNYYMHGMGSINIQEAGKYYFRLTNNGKLLFKLNNKELFKIEEINKKEVNSGSMYLDAGPTVFEFEYFPGTMNPYLLLEWSKDGENYEVVPDNVFNNLDALTAMPWEGDDEISVADSVPDNTLSEAEKKEGWKLLFDGKTTNGWHTYRKPGTIGKKWVAKDGALVFEGRDRFQFFVAGRKIEIGPTDKVKDGGEDIVSDESFENFELNLEWKISKGGNNGIFYTVKEIEEYDEVYKSSPEMQVMDNVGHKDGLIYKHRAGDLYDLIASDPIRVKPYGNWNKVRIIKNNGKIEHWLNGTKVVSFDTGSEEWKDLISKSKFAEYEHFASPGPGKIGFQDHDNLVYYKNIKIKELK